MGGECGRNRHARGYLAMLDGSMTGAAELSLGVSRSSPARLRCSRRGMLRTTRCCALECARRCKVRWWWLAVRRPYVDVLATSKRIVKYVLDLRSAGPGRWGLCSAAAVLETR